MKRCVPFHRPSISAGDIAAVTRVLRSGWLTTGMVARRFEEAYAARVGAKYAVAVCSGTAALHLGLEAVGVRRGDEVIVPTMTFAATAEVVAYLGARPVLVDCRPDTFNVSVEAVQKAITRRTRAVVPVHMAGQACEMDAIRRIARKRGIAVVDDAAHCGPTLYRGRMIGTWADVSAFSFYATKNITTGEGGMAVTDSARLAARMRIMSLHGISRDAWKRYTSEGSWYYEILEAGFKYNLSDIQAALGLSQLSRMEAFRDARERIARRYTAAFSQFPELIVPYVDPAGKHAWHLYILQIRPERLTIDRDEFIGVLRRRGIGASVHFIPLHMHPYYRKTYGYKSGDFPNALQVYRRCISLPIFPAMRQREVDAVIAAVVGIVKSHRRKKWI